MREAVVTRSQYFRNNSLAAPLSTTVVADYACTVNNVIFAVPQCRARCAIDALTPRVGRRACEAPSLPGRSAAVHSIRSSSRCSTSRRNSKCVSSATDTRLDFHHGLLADTTILFDVVVDHEAAHIDVGDVMNAHRTNGRYGCELHAQEPHGQEGRDRSAGSRADSDRL